ncbi:hypothetical protein BDQ17DRAFT_1434473 [Cyathus striatus]|nr:hypothetical protein BDQ17DRAFT_1434473 [Cyathus striatus]
MRRGFLLQASRKSHREDVSTSNATQARIPSSDYQVAQLMTFNESPSNRWGFTPELQSLPNETSTLPPGGFILCRLPPGNDIPGASECLISTSLHSKLLNTPGFPKPIENASPPAYRISRTPTRGLGMFATRALSIGDLLIAERPLLVCPIHHYIPGFREIEHDFTMCPFMNEAYLSLIVSRMSEENRKHFMALFNAGLEFMGGHLFPLTGIVGTNAAFGEGFLRELMDDKFDEAGSYLVVLKDCSRINHSCRPNIIATFHTASFTYHFRAARPIAEGEEITYCYAAIDAPHIVRTEDLMKFYRFKCTCDSCISPTHESDITRTTMFTRVKALEERFQQFRSPIGNPYDGPERRVVSREAYLLVLEMQGEELHASEAYVRAVKIVSLSYVRLAQDMRSRLNVDITKIDELSTLLTTGLRVVRAHRGEEHEDYVHMSSMARELGM